jgi:hypothetical protein
MQNLDWEALRPELFTARPRPLYDADFWRALSSVPAYPGYDSQKILRLFLEAFESWLHSSRLNRISGLEKFPVRNVIAGVTHALDDMHVRHGESLVVLPEEYSYHRRIRPNVRVKRPEDLKRGDVLAMAVPFAKFGGLHPQTSEILRIAEVLRIPVHVDAAWYGCLRGFEFDYSHPAIQSVAFSLSKGLGLGANRIGVRYSRERLHGPVSVLDESEMPFELHMWTGIHFIKRFGSDWLQTKYGPAYNLICEKYGLRKADAIHLAFAQSGEEWTPVGLRPFLSALVEGRNEFEYCRQPPAPMPQA